MAKYEGGCACGAVRYETDAEPIMAAHCQCGKCQKLTGSAHSSFAAFPEPALKIEGAVKYWNYKADSGNDATRGHCPICGSALFAKTSGFKDMMAITLGSLDVPSRITPQMAFFSSKALPWDHLDPGLQRFPAMPQM